MAKRTYRIPVSEVGFKKSKRKGYTELGVIVNNQLLVFELPTDVAIEATKGTHFVIKKSLVKSRKDIK